MKTSPPSIRLRVNAGLGFCLLAFVLGISSCTTQGTFVALGARLPPRADDAPVDVFRSGMPSRDFNRIARLEAHLEKTHLIPSNFKEAEGVLKKQARLAGGDAIIEIKEQRSFVGETLIYHVTATAIAYR